MQIFSTEISASNICKLNKGKSLCYEHCSKFFRTIFDRHADVLRKDVEYPLEGVWHIAVVVDRMLPPAFIEKPAKIQ